VWLFINCPQNLIFALRPIFHNTHMQNLSELNAISPIDGRYRNKTVSLSRYFSEEALIKYRVLVEIEYFIALCELPLPQLEGVNKNTFEPLRDIYRKLQQ
jgi:adenylosuccinate lyase